jgi:hypothetical protein
LLSGRLGRWLYTRANFSPRWLLPMAYTFITPGDFSIDDDLWHRLTSDEIKTIGTLLKGPTLG